MNLLLYRPKQRSSSTLNTNNSEMTYVNRIDEENLKVLKVTTYTYITNYTVWVTVLT